MAPAWPERAGPVALTLPASTVPVEWEGRFVAVAGVSVKKSPGFAGGFTAAVLAVW